MTELNDHELLAEFARTGSEAAFATLTARHVNLVYSAALRFAGNPHHAEEITQAVFIILARKAGKLSPRIVLSGWLYQTARLTAANFVKGEIRRQHREQEAYMQSTLNEPDAAAWVQITPLLDEAMGHLGETDRNAVVLRFFENKTAQEVGATLKLNEAAAHKRVTRAVEKLRKFFTKRGIALSAVAIAGAVSANSVQAAPAGLAVAIAATATKGAAVTAAVTTLVKGTLKIMTYAKLKLALGVAAGIVLVGGAATAVISQTGSGDPWTPQEIAKQSQDAYAALSSYSDSGTTVVESSAGNSKTTFTTRLSRPNLYRIDWTQTVGGDTKNGIVWSEGNGDFMASSLVGQNQNIEPQKIRDAQQAFSISAAVSGRGGSVIPETFFNKSWSAAMMVATLGRSELTRQNDAKVGGVDCHVFSSVIDIAKLVAKEKLTARKMDNLNNLKTIKTTSTFWIGKRDHLIHQVRTSVEGASITMPRQSDDNIKTILERQNIPATPEAIAAWRTQMDAMFKQAQGAKYVFTETHENILVNQKFSPADFAQ